MVSLIIVAVVVGTWQLLRDSVNLALMQSRQGLSRLQSKPTMAERPGVSQCTTFTSGR